MILIKCLTFRYIMQEVCPFFLDCSNICQVLLRKLASSSDLGGTFSERNRKAFIWLDSNMHQAHCHKTFIWLNSNMHQAHWQCAWCILGLSQMKALRFLYENALGGRILHFLVNNKSEYYLSIPAPQSKRFSSKKSVYITS